MDDPNLGVGVGHGHARRKRPLVYDDPEQDDLDSLHLAETGGDPNVAAELAKLRAMTDQDVEALERGKERELVDESEEMEYLDRVAEIAGDEMTEAFDEDDLTSEGGREPRKSPASRLGTKRIGMVVLPRKLTDAVQKRVDSWYSAFTHDGI